MLMVAAGDHEAFEALYLGLAPGVYGLALCLVGDRAVAQDVTATAFANLWTQAPSFNPSLGTARTWVMTMTHRLALDAARRESAPLAERPKHDVVDDVDLGLDVATDQQRLALALAYHGGFTPDGVANLLGLPASTVTIQIREGLRRLGGGAARTG